MTYHHPYYGIDVNYYDNVVKYFFSLSPKKIQTLSLTEGAKSW